MKIIMIIMKILMKENENINNNNEININNVYENINM